MERRNVYLNGQIVSISQARVSVQDVGFLYGVSTFTSMLIRGRRVVRFDRHLDRLAEAIEVLGIHVEADESTLRQAVDDLLDANELTDARCRVTLTPGPLGERRPTTLVVVEPLPPASPEHYHRGVGAIITSLHQQVGDPTYGYKTGCYLTRQLARREAAAKGCDDALWFTPDKRLAEGCFSNVFLVSGGVVRTPPRDTPVLPGVVRQAVLELCQTLGIDADDRGDLTVDDLLGADEVFLSSSIRGIRPVRHVERHEINAGKPGPLTSRLARAYRDLLQRDWPSAGDPCPGQPHLPGEAPGGEAR
jgi:branched-subunit amino acid aminotransferase/4-amino-4-deoxychorismate lyase